MTVFFHSICKNKGTDQATCPHSQLYAFVCSIDSLMSLLSISNVSGFYLAHYANMPMQFTAMFHGCINGNFQVTKCYIFFIFAQKFDCGYTLKPPQ